MAHHNVVQISCALWAFFSMTGRFHRGYAYESHAKCTTEGACLVTYGTSPLFLPNVPMMQGPGPSVASPHSVADSEEAICVGQHSGLFSSLHSALSSSHSLQLASQQTSTGAPSLSKKSPVAATQPDVHTHTYAELQLRRTNVTG